MSILNMYIDQEEGEYPTVLHDDVDFEGEVESSESMLIKGKIKNSKIKASMIMVFQSGFLGNRVNTDTLVVLGTVEGSFEVKKNLCLARGGKIDGTTSTSKLLVEEGGTLHGSIKMKTVHTQANRKSE